MDVISTTGSTKMVNFLSNYCRSCSTICENMTPLQAFNADQNSEQLLTFFNIKNNPEDFPKNICSDCVDQLHKILIFKTKCESSSNLFQAMVLEYKQIQNEGLKKVNESTKYIETLLKIAEPNPNLTESDNSNHVDDPSDNDSWTYTGVFEEEPEEEPKPYKCPKCEKTFRKEFHLANHLEVHDDHVKYKCNTCDKLFKYKDSFEYHFKTCCPKDGETPARNKILKLTENLTEIPVGHKCKYCDKIYQSKYTLVKHTTNIHENPEGSYKVLCSFCGRSFRYEGDLKTHMKFKHSDERDIQCEHCDKRFKTKSYYRRHERNVHLNKRNFKCDHCSKAFNCKSILTNHLRTHTGEKPFVCAICEKAFSHDATLYKHKKLVHGSPNTAETRMGTRHH